MTAYEVRIEQLLTRVAALEAALADHRAAILQLQSVPAIRFALGGAHMLVAELKVEQQTAPKSTSPKATEIHHEDAAIKHGDKLRQLAQSDGMRGA